MMRLGRVDSSCRWLVAAFAVIGISFGVTPASARAQDGTDGHAVLGGPLVQAAVQPASAAPQMPVGFENRPDDERATGEIPGISNGVATRSIRRSLEMLRFDVARTNPGYGVGNVAEGRAAPDAQRGYRGRPGRRHSGDRAVMGLVLGAIGGVVIGGVIGAAIAEDSCHCDNPGLHGFAIGAPIGAVVGGFLGYALAR
jgi:hypothetical protein